MTGIRGKLPEGGRQENTVRARRPTSVEGKDKTAPVVDRNRVVDQVEEVVAPEAIERALGIYKQLQPRDQSVIVQARKILTQHIYGMVDRGERDEQRLTVGGLAHLKAMERDHEIRSAHRVEKTFSSG